MGVSDVTRDGVLRAISECLETGEEQFLERYGYGPAKTYHLIYQGNRLPSKAIFGVAHAYSAEGLQPLKFDDFSGGEQQVAKPLRKLGFEVIGGATRNPTWTTDELLLALKMYVDFDGNPPGKASDEVKELSEVLSKLGKKLGVFGDENYRNANGVYMKMMNFRRFDERYQSQGKSGLTAGGKAEELVWNDFANDTERLSAATQAIISFLDTEATQLPQSHDFDYDDEEVAAAEGRLISRIHKSRERNANLTKRKKAQATKRNGRLACEACGFDFHAVYGSRGDGFIECHHTKPVSELRPDQKTKLSDLVLLCANCHRMVHSKRPWLEVSELKELLQKTP